MALGVKAIVVSGRGIATEKRSDDIVKLSNILGSSLVSGSLNLVARKPLWMSAKSAILKTEQGHLYWMATLDDLPVIVNRWKGGCPAHVYEIYANTRLRKTLKLNDGDQVCLKFDRVIVDVDKNRSFIYMASWYLTWFCREKMYYRSDAYLKLVSRKPISKFTWRAMQM